MKHFGLSAAVVGVSLVAMAPGAMAQTAPATPAAAEPYTYTPWYERKILPDPLSATIAFWSNYRFRGVSQTSNAPGYNGSLDLEFEIMNNVSFYAGVWASNINFNGGFKPRVEVDVYGGVKGKLFDKKLTWNVQLIGYLYPGSTSAQSLNYFEVMPSAYYDFGLFEIGGGVAISPNFTAGSGFAAYPFGDITVPIPIAILEPYKVAAFGHIGYQSVEKNAKFGLKDYLDWEVGVKWELYGLKMGLKYGDTNITKAQCFGGADWCSAKVVFTVSKTF